MPAHARYFCVSPPGYCALASTTSWPGEIITYTAISLFAFLPGTTELDALAAGTGVAGGTAGVSL